MQKSYSQIRQNKDFISSSLSGKNMITICNIWATFAWKWGVTSQRVRIKVWQILFNPHYFWSTSCKKIMITTFWSFPATDYKGHFRKFLTWILKFGFFSRYHAYIFEDKVKLPDAEFNAESTDTHFQPQKWKRKKLVCPFLIALFHFET